MPDIHRYSGDLTATLDRGQMLGPDRKGRYLAVKSVEYNADADITTVHWRGLTPDEFRERVGVLMGGQRDRSRIRGVFGVPKSAEPVKQSRRERRKARHDR